MSAPAPPHVRPSWWLQRALGDEAGAGPAAPLDGEASADVCVVGGGYTGLWTALELKRRDPGVEVVVLEAEICGHGASGRNGGFAMTWWSELDNLVKRCGPEQARFLAQCSSDAVGRIEDLEAELGADFELRRGGLIWASAAPAQDGVGRAAFAAAQQIGCGERLLELSGEEARARTGSPLLRRAVLDPASASVQPALLARGLRTAALAAGVRIHEHSPMRELDRAGRAVLTPGGRVRAGRVVLATNAWLAALPELRRTVMPISSMIVLTEPLGERLEELGWTGGELLSDGRMMVHYIHVTADGRIAFGRGGGPLGVAGRLPARIHFTRSLAATVAADFRRFFPGLADVRLEAAWGGAVDRSPTHLPFFAPIDEAGAILAGGGYSGNGVVPSVVGGQVLADLALERRTELSSSALVGLPPAEFPPEPFRSLGGSLVRAAVGRRERLEERGRKADPATRALAGMVGFTLPRRG